MWDTFNFETEENDKNVVCVKSRIDDGGERVLFLNKKNIIDVINTLRQFTLDEFKENSFYGKSIKLETNENCLLIEFTYSDIGNSSLSLFCYWKKDESKNFPDTIIPYNLNDGTKLMSRFIEPLLQNLEQYLDTDDKAKLIKPWK